MNSSRYCIRKRAEADFGVESASFGEQFFSQGPSWRSELVTASQLFNSRGYGSTVAIYEGLHFDQRAVLVTFVSTHGWARLSSVPQVNFYDWLCQRSPILMAGSECTLVSASDGAGNPPAGHDSDWPRESQKPDATSGPAPEGLESNLFAADSAGDDVSIGGIDLSGAAIRAAADSHSDNDSWEEYCPDAGSGETSVASPEDQSTQEHDTCDGETEVGDHEQDDGEDNPFSLEPPPTPVREEFVEVFVEDDEQGVFVLWGDETLCLVAEHCDGLGATHLKNALAVSQDDGTALQITSTFEAG